ncbi:uncharacterized protein BO97DRAFT_476285 [Aspergillus homomorphus CBS 101889]|uniref:Uncharacterized protein n=1 Tax=Aspergillus homomorphus (strain CBS 101889) TaxID=1450537 RepID=A0A395I6Z6_ASPHC|nr:hypothetical protein BO97DRAFT_476285 [Aspergillus homomorphus CBS 101889]RAL14868.1 hypothetical protein BO97DRAFT_476285 [Aspergillus homomorphus CBS 101889]
MANEQPQTPDQQQAAAAAAALQTQREADYQRFKTYTAWTLLIASPILIALPPRKLDNLTVLQLSAFSISANHLTRERTGRSIVDRIEDKIASGRTRSDGTLASLGSGLPSERALEIQARLRADREKQIEEAKGEELAKLKAREEFEKPVLQRVWMGSETEGWKERRIREEQQALAEGKGYGDLIREHIWDVWTWGKGKDEGEK